MLGKYFSLAETLYKRKFNVEFAYAFLIRKHKKLSNKYTKVLIDDMLVIKH